MEKQICFLKIKNNFYHNIINFIDDENNNTMDWESQLDKITICKKDLYQALKLITKIANNHHRYPNLYNKIDRFLLHFKKNIIDNYSNNEIFKICKSNKRILLFMIENKIINLDETLIKELLKDKYADLEYQSYFSPEINKISNQNNELFEINRKCGENASYICSLIRKDDITEFVAYVNRANFRLTSKIQHSIFETNSFLMNKNPTLIKYAAFFGSIQIFKYLYLNGVSLTPSLWKYSIHGNNPDIIHFLEEKHIQLTEELCLQLLYESIKCYHNDIANYILLNYRIKLIFYLSHFLLIV